ncbi:MAG: hypothetical protein ACPG5B_12695 [Chitinophagales bacterium]
MIRSKFYVFITKKRQRIFLANTLSINALATEKALLDSVWDLKQADIDFGGLIQ